MYEKVPTSLDFVAREKAIEKFWKEHDIFDKKYRFPKKRPHLHLL